MLGEPVRRPQVRHLWLPSPGAIRKATVQWRIDEDTPVELPWSRVGEAPLFEGEPWRQPRFFPKQHYRPGWMYFRVAERLLPFSSRFEFDCLLELELHPDLSSVLTQPMRMAWQDAGQPRTHVPDVLVAWADGEVEVLDVQHPGRIDSPEWLHRCSVVAWLCDRVGFGYRIIDRRPGAERLANLELLAGARHAPPWIESIRVNLRAVNLVGLSLGQVESHCAAEPLLARPCVLHLLCTGELLVDLDRALSLTDTLVRASRL